MWSSAAIFSIFLQINQSLWLVFDLLTMSKILLLLICLLCAIFRCTASDLSGLQSRGKSSAKSKDALLRAMQEKEERDKEAQKQIAEAIKYPGVNEKVENDQTKIYFYPPPNKETSMPEPIDLSGLRDGKYSIQCHQTNSFSCKEPGDWKAWREVGGKWTIAKLVGYHQCEVLCGALEVPKPSYNTELLVDIVTVKKKIHSCWNQRRIVMLKRWYGVGIPLTNTYPRKLVYGTTYQETRRREEEKKKKEHEKLHGERTYELQLQKEEDNRKNIENILRKNEMLNMQPDALLSQQELSRRRHAKKDDMSTLDDLIDWDKRNEHRLGLSKGREEYYDMYSINEREQQYLRGFAEGYRAGLKRG